MTTGAGALAPWQEVGEGAYRRRYEQLDLNIGVVRGADALLVVDTRATHREARVLLDELRVFGRRRVRWVVNTHWHWDHTFGNALFPDSERWGHVRTAARLEESGEEARERIAALLPEYGDDMGEVVITPPDHLVETRATIDLGDRAVDLVHLGRGHTDTDLVAVAAGARLVFAGDLVEDGAPPSYGDDSYPLDWPATARALEILLGEDPGRDAWRVVPGHGDVVDARFVHDQSAAIERVASLVKDLHAAGVPAGAALEEGGDRWPFPRRRLHDAVLRGYAQLDGTLP